MVMFWPNLCSGLTHALYSLLSLQPALPPPPSISYILDAVDPLVLLLRGGGGDTVHIMVPLYHSAVCLRLARLNQLTPVVGDVQLKAVLVKG